MSIGENVNALREQMAAAAKASGRAPGDILLVAATKTQAVDTIQQAVAAGVDACGENRVQELQEKEPQGAYTGVPLHFIGHLQKNKLKKVVGVCDLIQSVDSLVLAEEIARRSGELRITQDILIQVNIGADPAKFGIAPDELSMFLEKIAQLGNIKVRGLMTILPIEENSGCNRRLFCKMNKLFVDIKAKTYDNVSMDFLSMGMSGDFYAAILEGSNMIRVGTSIFGARDHI